jgi:hypothetical protein
LFVRAFSNREPWKRPAQSFRKIHDSQLNPPENQQLIPPFIIAQKRQVLAAQDTVFGCSQ